MKSLEIALAELTGKEPSYDYKHDNTFEGIIVAIDITGFVTLIGGESVWALHHTLGQESIMEYMSWDGEDRKGFPEEPGIYRCTIDYIFHQGYFEGYPCDGESDWEIVARDFERIDLPAK